MMMPARLQPFVLPVVIGIERPPPFTQSAAGTLLVGGRHARPCDARGGDLVHRDGPLERQRHRGPRAASVPASTLAAA